MEAHLTFSTIATHLLTRGMAQTLATATHSHVSCARMARRQITLMLTIAALALAAFASCASKPTRLPSADEGDGTICPDSRDLVCLSGIPECAMDRVRGCQVCACPPMFGSDVPAPGHGHGADL